MSIRLLLEEFTSYLSITGIGIDLVCALGPQEGVFSLKHI